MKTIRSLILAAALATPAFAINWTVGGVYSGNALAFLNTSGETYSSSFASLTTQGFNPAAHILTSATVSFWFADDESDGSEQVDIFVNGMLAQHQVANDFEVDGVHPEATFAKYTFNITDAATLASLASGASITYTVRQQVGDTYLKIAGLTGTGTTRGNQGVPDGGSTVALLGLGLIGLAAVRKRLV